MVNRRPTRKVIVGDEAHGYVGIGGDAPVSVQSPRNLTLAPGPPSVQFALPPRAGDERKFPHKEAQPQPRESSQNVAQLISQTRNPRLIGAGFWELVTSGQSRAW